MGNVMGNFFEPDMTHNALKKKSKSSQKESNQFDQLLVINPANALPSSEVLWKLHVQAIYSVYPLYVDLMPLRLFMFTMWLQ